MSCDISPLSDILHWVLHCRYIHVAANGIISFFFMTE